MGKFKRSKRKKRIVTTLTDTLTFPTWINYHEREILTSWRRAQMQHGIKIYDSKRI